MERKIFIQKKIEKDREGEREREKLNWSIDGLKIYSERKCEMWKNEKWFTMKDDKNEFQEKEENYGLKIWRGIAKGFCKPSRRREKNSEAKK